MSVAGPNKERIPEADDRVRLVCDECGFVDYINPTIVVGTVSTHENNFLLVKRDIEPRKGYWTIPAGFLEVGETLAQGAVRETWEEARAQVIISALLGVYNIVHISQVYMVFRAEMQSSSHEPGPESQDSALFSWDEIPWDYIAFPSVTWALNHYKQTAGNQNVVPMFEPPESFWDR